MADESTTQVLSRQLLSADHWVSPQARYTVKDLVRLYNLPEEYDGTGQKIGILLPSAGLDASDLEEYFSALGIRYRPPTIVEVGKAKNSPCKREDLRRFLLSIGAGYEGTCRAEFRRPDNSPMPVRPEGMEAGSALFEQITFTLEAIADVEIAGATAPGAELRVYVCENSADGIAEAIERAVQDGVVSICTSWGVDENPPLALPFVTKINDALRAAAKAGVTCCCASGDTGARPGFKERTPPLAVSFPASSPFALACGGTTIVSDDGGIPKEIVWNETHFTFDGASGGGFSQVNNCPSWQFSRRAPRKKDRGDAHLGKGGKRGVPDVAGNAGGSSGMWLRVAGLNAISFGTSSVSPFYAGLIARLTQALGGKPRFMPPLFYQPSVRETFRSVTSGTNVKRNLGTEYSAQPGWDACTGLGTPDGVALLRALSALPEAVAPDLDDEPPAGPPKPKLIREDLLIVADDGQIYFVPEAEWKHAVVDTHEEQWLAEELLSRGVALAAIPEPAEGVPDFGKQSGDSEDPRVGALIACYLVNISGLRKRTPFVRRG